MTIRYFVSILATLAVFVASAAYLSFGVLAQQPFTHKTTVWLTVPASNGLHTGSAVLLRGVPIGEVTSVAYAGKTVEVSIAYDSRYEIPVDSQIEIAAQSMLGESSVSVVPPLYGGDDVIADGQTLAANVVDVPASVPELLGSTQQLLDQVDPGLVDRLVTTLSTALEGTQDAVARLTPAAQVLAATMIYSQPALVTIIGNATSMLQRGQWIGPALRPTRPELLYAGESLRRVINSVKPFADFTRGGELIGERWKPVLNRSAPLVAKIAPPIGTLASTLLPAAQRSGATLANLDIATLLDRVMQMMPGNGLRLNVTIPK
ncbi:MlaD family protein [Gordonia sp. ABSL49_1]|uniref:MlaD family protein n=1 Tax=Gordonia sp. ABSL49_1 TaxID=2920941 RepID=UPI001F0EB2D7|nr:MlaD family protein [Gordonia sp. ABSL49_1]MCH5644968.1 MlaD family protein [Gordonia sp. ABSL49_1]